MMSDKTYFCIKIRFGIKFEIKIRNKMAILILLLQFPFHKNFSVIMLNLQIFCHKQFILLLASKNSIFVYNFLYKYAVFTDTDFIIKMCDIISLDQWSMLSYAFHHIIKYLSVTNHPMIHLESSENISVPKQ